MFRNSFRSVACSTGQLSPGPDRIELLALIALGAIEGAFLFDYEREPLSELLPVDAAVEALRSALALQLHAQIERRRRLVFALPGLDRIGGPLLVLEHQELQAIFVELPAEEIDRE